MNALRWSLVLIALAAGILAASIWAFQRHAIYRFPDRAVTPASAGLEAYEVRSFSALDGTDLSAWVAPPAEGQPVLIAFGGNFSGVDAMAAHMAPFVDAGLGVVVPVYRGANGSPGRTTEATMAADAVALHDALDGLVGRTIAAADRVSYGFSLGTSPAIALAGARPVAALVIEAGFDRLCRFQERRLKGVPMCLLMWAERHDAIDAIGTVRAPLLMGHGTLDRALDPGWGEALFSAAPEPRDFRLYPEGTHTNLLGQGFAEDVIAFVDSRPR